MILIDELFINKSIYKMQSVLKSTVSWFCRHYNGAAISTMPYISLGAKDIIKHVSHTEKNLLPVKFTLEPAKAKSEIECKW